MGRYQQFRQRVSQSFLKFRIQLAAAIYSKVDDSSGWTNTLGRYHDRDYGEAYELYHDALEASRDNPMVKRIITTITDFIIGEKFTIGSEIEPLAAFIEEFWNHPENNIDLRLEQICEEMTRAGDVFPILFRNAGDGMSYIRFATKDQIHRIDTRSNDWEKETAYHQSDFDQSSGISREWQSQHSAEPDSPEIMLHYAINRPIGALFGEGDVNTIVKWAMRYERLLADRVRLNMAVRIFLWFVKVPTNKVLEKRSQYTSPPAAGSVIVHDEGEEWNVKSPDLKGADAKHDLDAVRQFVTLGTNLPPHWMGERGSNRAEAQAMEAPATRFLKRRQKYFTFMLQDIIYNAYQRAHLLLPDRYPALPTTNYKKLFTVQAPDLSRSDNVDLANAAQTFSKAIQEISSVLPAKTPEFARWAIKKMLKFAGEEIEKDALAEIVDAAFSAEPDPFRTAVEEIENA
jgi:hypothetical protein